VVTYFGSRASSRPSADGSNVEQRESGVVADRPDIAEVVGEALEFHQERAKPCCATRRLDLQRCLGCAGKCERIGDRAVSRNTSCEFRATGEIGACHQALDALVRVAEPFFESHDGFAARGEAEMSGLDDACMHGAYRDPVQMLAFDWQERVGRHAGQDALGIPQRMAESPAPVIEPGAHVRQSDGIQSE
jgi:hypothetical protein